MSLTRLGVDTITSLLENSEQARLCNLLFNQSLDYMLQLYPWNFALVRTALALSAEEPEYDYNYAYQLPTDPYCLQVVAIKDEYSYKIEGRKLLTDATDVYILYIKRVIDMNELSALFIEAFVLYLASQLCMPLTNNKGMSDSLFTQYQVALQKARLRDAQEDTPKLMQEVSWITARRGYSGSTSWSNYS
jgi:hypothetical protein